MPTLEKIRFLTVNYSRLQGLKAFPSGLLLFLVVLWANGQKRAGQGSDPADSLAFYRGRYLWSHRLVLSPDIRAG